MAEQKASIYELEITPLTQLKYALLFTVSIMVIYYMFNTQNHDMSTLRNYYTIPMSFTLVFGVFNAILSLSSPDQNKYYGMSLVSYFIFCAVTITLGRLLSGIGLDDAGSYRWIYFVFTFGYILFLAIVRTMRWVVFFAQKQDKRMMGK
jgi:hypothetical protein